jgi:hypothetical protein
MGSGHGGCACRPRRPSDAGWDQHGAGGTAPGGPAQPRLGPGLRLRRYLGPASTQGASDVRRVHPGEPARRIGRSITAGDVVDAVDDAYAQRGTSALSNAPVPADLVRPTHPRSAARASRGRPGSPRDSHPIASSARSAHGDTQALPRPSYLAGCRRTPSPGRAHLEVV